MVSNTEEEHRPHYVTLRIKGDKYDKCAAQSGKCVFLLLASFLLDNSGKTEEREGRRGERERQRETSKLP